MVGLSLLLLLLWSLLLCSHRTTLSTLHYSLTGILGLFCAEIISLLINAAVMNGRGRVPVMLVAVSLFVCVAQCTASRIVALQLSYGSDYR